MRKQLSSTPTRPTCFVVSPIGQEGSDVHRRFKEVLDFVIKPAAASSGYNLAVVRADDMNRPGSFIKDILQQLLDSYVVIADLTSQNPNVFYELGVRHALSPRTILIAQSVDDIPADLREYRTIVYDTSARGAANFADRLHKYLKDIFANPHRPDNPVMDRLGSVLETQTAGLQDELKSVKKELEGFFKKGERPAGTMQQAPTHDSAQARVDRILKLHGAQRQFIRATIEYGKGDATSAVSLPAEEGPFDLYLVMDGDSIVACWYIALPRGPVQFDRLLADIRVLMGAASKGLQTGCVFVVATNEDCSGMKAASARAFAAVKKFVPIAQRRLFTLDIWDDNRLSDLETQLGIRVSVPARPARRKGR